MTSCDDMRQRMAADPRSSEEILEQIVADPNSEATSMAIGILHARGGEKEFAMGKDLAANADPILRGLGADILGQLGFGDSFQTESVDILIQLLQDPDGSVVKDAGIALGHRRDARAVPHLLKLVAHPDPGIRYGVASGLKGQDEPAAIKALIILSADSHQEVRDWATFGLGSFTEVDTPEIREALINRLADSVAEIRGEALVGLAERKDRRVVEAIKQELEKDWECSLVFKAAEMIADASFYPLLKQVKERFKEDMTSYHISHLDDALAACDPSKRDPSTGSG